ncbi:hypothetical protein FRX31_019430 [Thalictrum thalictroides]|uniref:4Fe-4S ferredoxin-type domain-containing protein n=1 Tax=Thalictrum thalictroides TaxID=46969 RepID=A0A7J6W0R5_THATH|nr:hypothetical protein FRX31_019430 [Thalictrum thalictroides]
MVCPANAISLTVNNADVHTKLKGGVITERCYGCGRCFPVCPYDKTSSIMYVRDATATSELLKRNDVDAVEIHISGRQAHNFEEFWNSLKDSIGHLKLIAVSLPDVGDLTVSLMSMMYTIMEPHLHCYNLWQLDGRPMSGDIGRGATRGAIRFACRLVTLKNRPRGTNRHTIDGLKREGLFQTSYLENNCRDEKSEVQSLDSPPSLIGGVAYGG